MIKALTAVAVLILGVAVQGRAPAVEGQVAARGSAYLPGGDVYNGSTRVAETRSLVLPQGSTLVFWNVDVDTHNVTSGDPLVDGPLGNGLFGSAFTTFNTKVPVVGVGALPPGQYRFFCANHASKLTGTLVIV